MHWLAPWAEGVVYFLLLPLGITLLAVARQFYLRIKLPKRRQQLLDSLTDLSQLSYQPQILLEELLHNGEFRLEALDKRLTAETLEHLRKTDLPERLRRQLKWRSFWPRVRGILLLGLLRDPQSIGLLRSLVNDPDEPVAMAAIHALGRFNDLPTARFLLNLLNSHQWLNLSRIASVLEGVRVDLSEPLIEKLQSDDSPSRYWAATLLGRYNSDKVRAALVRGLADNDPHTRAALLDSLSKIGDYTCAVSLINSLEDPVWYVRAQAALAIGKTQRSEAAEALIAALADPVWWVRHDAMRAIEMLLKTQQATRVVAQLLAHIDHPDAYARNQIAALLSNHGVVGQLQQSDRRLGKRGQDARRLLLLIHRAGGAPQLKLDSGWQQFLKSRPSEVAL